MYAQDLTRWTPTDHARAARLARVVVRAERRYARRAASYERGRRSTEPVDTMRLALLLIEADRLVHDLAKARP